MSATHHGPPPSKHVFLSQIHKLPDLLKIRFLGCVVSYDVSRGVLRLRHDQSSADLCEVDVDITHVLGSITSPACLFPGYWLNVIGYVQRPSRRRKRNTAPPTPTSSTTQTTVQAVLVWDATALRIQAYERALADKQAVERAVRMATQQKAE